MPSDPVERSCPASNSARLGKSDFPGASTRCERGPATPAGRLYLRALRGASTAVPVGTLPRFAINETLA